MDEFEIKESARARHLRITVHGDGRIVITTPSRYPRHKLEAFIRERSSWIAETKAKFARVRARRERQRAKLGLAKAEPLPKPRKGSKAYKEAREIARTVATERLQHFNRTYGFRYGTISIRDQKTRWGSCSAQGNLSFNYRLAFLPPILQDYLIVHELCHVREHNHSEKFWEQVARTIPDHVLRRKALQLYDMQ